MLDIKTGIKAFDQGIFAMFAELIDVAYQVRNTEHIWAHSTLEFMQRPVPLVDVLHPTGVVMYPVANLSYLINDTLLIFYERQPSKVMRMLYLSCVEQNLAHLPREIKVSKEMWHNINTVADCKELQQLFSFVSADENGFVTLQTSPALQNIDSFEQWCVERKFPFTELAEFKMLPTTKIAGQLAKISREIFHDDISFIRSNKDGLILYLHQLQLLQQLCLCFLQSCKPQLLQNRFYEVDFTPTSDANKQHVDEVLELVKSSLNSINPATSIFSLVQSNKILCQRNPFAALISKFRFIARD